MTRVEYTMDVTRSIVYDVCRDYINDLEHVIPVEISSVLLGYIRARRFDLLAACSSLSTPTQYGVDVFKALRQIEAFFKKNDFFADDVKCMQAAKSSFMRAEKLCRITNRRLQYYYLKPDRLDPDLKFYVEKMQSYLQSTLGPIDRFISKLPEMIRVTSGATVSASRRRSLPYLKVRKRLDAPRSAWPYLDALSRNFGYGPMHFRYVNLNRVEVVPKSWKTHRTIACEPSGLVPLQLAFDVYAKTRLLRKGIDLSSQLKNQELARQGSIDGSLATIDMSMASDTVSFNLVAWLFPRDWFEYLRNVRSSGFKGPFGSGQYAKFSSMGNGTTFAIETLVFAAACKAVGARNFSVYGDDIILETEHVPKLFRLLRFLGFVVNQDKSFHEGPFRESCGKDWFLGTDVTPKYVRREPRAKSQWAHFINTMAAISVPGGKMWTRLIHKTIETKVHLVPYNAISTSGVWIDPSSAYNSKVIRNKNWVPIYRSYVSSTKERVVRDSRTLFLWHLSANNGKEPTEPRISTSVPLTSHTYVRRWVHWIPPMERTPVHLYWWAELLLSASLRSSKGRSSG